MDVDSPNALKRCSSAPQINNLVSTSAVVGVQPMDEGQSQPGPSSSSSGGGGGSNLQLNQAHLPGGLPEPLAGSGMLNTSSSLQGSANDGSRESLPTSFSNIFTPRVRRFSASFSPLAVISNGSASPGRNGSGTPGPRLTPRISQLRQEECADVTNTREVNHEREIHSAMQMSQSYEDLTLVAENWSFTSSASKMANEDLQNPLHVALPTIGSTCCSSPSPTSRGGIGLQYPTTSPSPTRKFVTRRSMSPCPLRPSPLSSSVKRKFDLDDNYGNCYSPPPKKIFTSERGSSPVCQTPSPSPICPSPDSSTTSFENGSNNNGNGNGSNHPPSGLFPLAATTSGSGRVTPKFFLSKLSGSPSPGPPVNCSGNPFGVGSGGASMHFGGNSASSSTCTTPTGPPLPIGSLIGEPGGLGGPETLAPGGTVAIMMDCGVSSSSSSSGSECRDIVAMEIGHTGAEGRTVGGQHDSTPSKADSSTSRGKTACDNQRQQARTGPSSAVIAASRELREQILKSVLDQDAAGSCNSNSSYTSSSSSSSSNSNSSCVTSDSNTSANSNISRLSGLTGGSSSSSSGNTVDSSSSSSSSASVVTDGSITTAAAAAAAAAAATAMCPQLTSFPMMAIPSSNLTKIAES